MHSAMRRWLFDSFLPLWSVSYTHLDDAIAAYYVRAAAEGRLQADQVDYVYQVPRQEAFERLSYVSGAVSYTHLTSPSSVAAKWRTSSRPCSRSSQ